MVASGPNGGRGTGVEMVTFSAFLARCGVGGGRRPRAPTGTTGILPVGGEDGVLPFQRARRPLSQWCGATGETPVVPVVCRNGRDARCPSRAAWGPAGGLSLAEGGAGRRSRAEWRAGRFKAGAERRRDVRRAEVGRIGVCACGTRGARALFCSPRTRVNML